MWAGRIAPRRHSSACWPARSAATQRVFAFYAAKLGVTYDSFEAVARTDFDVRGHMMADAPTSAFQKVTISISVVSDAPDDRLKEVERLSFEGCPGINTLREPVPVETRLTVTRTPAEKAA